MPRNFKEAIFFTLPMCSMMALGMSIWNLYLLCRVSLGNLAAGYLPAFITALLLDVLLVELLVKGLSFHFLKDYHKRWQKIAVISGGMVLMMVSLMSVYGLFLMVWPCQWKVIWELGEQILSWLFPSTFSWLVRSRVLY